MAKQTIELITMRPMKRIYAASSWGGVSLAAGASVTRSGNEDRTSISSSVALAMGPSLSPVARNSRIAISRDMSRLPLSIWLA
ncbi:MAG: hypothetical protein DI531_16070 [Brevundimonas sp.]|nr:MAG: hypothetical protein DI531_16070 [Brevundimonas sp.]